MNRVVAQSLAARRFTTLLLIAFAPVALVLAVFGLYGILSYTVAQRAQELGIRLALGAEPGKLMWLVIRDGLYLTILGSMAGLLGGAFLALAMSRFLFGIRSLDFASFAGSVLVLLLTSGLASYVPAAKLPARIPWLP
jgi:putative ABC transport system permease protein